MQRYEPTKFWPIFFFYRSFFECQLTLAWLQYVQLKHKSIDFYCSISIPAHAVQFNSNFILGNIAGTGAENFNFSSEIRIAHNWCFQSWHAHDTLGHRKKKTVLLHVCVFYHCAAEAKGLQPPTEDMAISGTCCFVQFPCDIGKRAMDWLCQFHKQWTDLQSAGLPEPSRHTRLITGSIG